MTTVEQRIVGPERARGQGLDRHQEESGNRAILALLTDPVRGKQVDLVMTYRRELQKLLRSGEPEERKAVNAYVQDRENRIATRHFRREPSTDA